MSRTARLTSITAAFGLALLSQACTGDKPAAAAAADTTAAMATPAAPAAPPELTARSAALVSAWNQEDATVAAAFFTDSAVVMVADSTYTGRAAIRDRWIKPGLPVVSDLSVSDQTYTGAGTTMTESGRFSETITMPKQAAAKNTGSYTAEWTNANGTWMISRFTVKDDKPMS